MQSSSSSRKRKNPSQFNTEKEAQREDYATTTSILSAKRTCRLTRYSPLPERLNAYEISPAEYENYQKELGKLGYTSEQTEAIMVHRDHKHSFKVITACHCDPAIVPDYLNHEEVTRIAGHTHGATCLTLVAKNIVKLAKGYSTEEIVRMGTGKKVREKISAALEKLALSNPQSSTQSNSEEAPKNRFILNKKLPLADRLKAYDISEAVYENYQKELGKLGYTSEQTEAIIVHRDHEHSFKVITACHCDPAIVPDYLNHEEVTRIAGRTNGATYLTLVAKNIVKLAKGYSTEEIVRMGAGQNVGKKISAALEKLALSNPQFSKQSNTEKINGLSNLLSENEIGHENNLNENDLAEKLPALTEVNRFNHPTFFSQPAVMKEKESLLEDQPEIDRNPFNK